MARAKPDVVLINNGGYPGAESCRVAALAARRAGVERVIHFVHNMAHPPAWPAPVERLFDRRIDHATDLWVTAATRASDELTGSAGSPASGSRPSTTGSSLPRRRTRAARTQSCAPSSASPGSPRPRRRGEPRAAQGAVAVVARARRAPRPRDPRRDGAVGDGPLRGRLADEARELGLNGSVRMLGWREDVDAILDQATCWCCRRSPTNAFRM